MPLLSLLIANLLFGGGLVCLCSVLEPKRNWARGILAFLAVALSVRYAYWRWTDTVDLAPAFNLAFLWPMLFLGVESFRFVEHAHAMLTLSKTTDRIPEADAHEKRLRQAAPRDLPAVDVFITTYLEPPEILQRTILGAKALDYPKFRVIVLDDGARPWLEDFCDSEGVGYIARETSVNAKAGNLNNGFAKTVGPDASPFMMLLDADFVPFRNFLWRTLGFFEDPRVAIVQTPQYFFNPDPPQMNLGSPDNWVDEQRFFFDVFQPSKDAFDMAFCCGSSCVLRRSAIEAIGGVPTGAVIEDIHLSYKLMANGFVTRYLAETLSNGMSPENMGEFVSQRVRWATGCVQALRLPFGPLQRNGLSLMQRSHYLSTVFYWMSLVFLPMWALAPAIYWLFDVPAYHADVEGLLTYQMPSIIMSQAYMIWTARKRLVPLIWEGVQLAFAIDASWAVWAMLFTGKPRTTRSTLKGVSTKRINVRLFGTVAALLGINIVGLIWGQMDARGAIGHVADQVNILWGLYAILMCGMAALLCVEVPRPRHEQRFTIDEPIALADGDTAVLTDISVSGARLTMANPPEDIDFMWRGIHSVRGKRVRSADGWGSYVLASDKALARELTVAIYTGGFQSSAVNFNLPRFFSSIGRRLLLNSQPTDRPGAPRSGSRR